MAEFISKINLGGTVYNIKDASVDSSIAAAKREIVGDASASFDTLGKIQGQLESKVSSVRGTSSIDVTESDGAAVVSAKISAESGNIIQVKTDGLYATAPEASEYSIEKDSSAGDFAAVYHLTKDGVAVGEAINIPKDYLVKSGSIVNGTWTGDDFEESETGTDKALKFIVNVKSGTATDEVIYINVKDLVDVYTAGAGVEISAANVVSAKVADATVNAVDEKETNKNFLKINDASALEVKGVDTDAVVFTENITVAGGPLSTLTSNWPSDWKDGDNCIIPAGKTAQEIFTGLFLKKSAGTLGNVSYNWTPVYANNPTCSLGATGSVEVGTELTVSAAAVKGLSNNVSTAKANASPGYFEGDTYHEGNYSQSVAGTCDDTNITYTATFNSSSVSNGDTVSVVPGTNTLSVSQSGSVASVGDLTATTIYGSYNTKEKNESISKSVTAKSYDDREVAAKGTSVSVTGVYKYYYGYIPFRNDQNYVGVVTEPSSLTDKKDGFLSTSNAASIESMTSTAAASALVILIPNSAKVSASKNSIGGDNLNTWAKVDDFDYTVGTTHTTYEVWVAHSKGAITYKDIAISRV